MGAIQHRYATATGQNFLFWSLHRSKSNWYQNEKYDDSKAD